MNCHTRNGSIKAQLKNAQKDDDPWYTINSPEDLFPLNVNVNLKLINESYLSFQVHPQIDIVPIYNRFEELLNGLDADS